MSEALLTLRQRSIYLERFRALREQDPSLTERGQPRVLTIDSSQGDESFMVFLDGSAQQGHAIGMQHLYIMYRG